MVASKIFLGDQKLLSQRFADMTNKPGKYFDKNGLFLPVKEGGSKKWVTEPMLEKFYNLPSSLNFFLILVALISWTVLSKTSSSKV